ncbi:hypothetical protein HYPSUDRAFT_43629 [Hypholoma sublateritium FD-334 SS-4]|uniref:GAF domain-containing protein n=1 Tax=Hypholoma sublateritium (strain FD-334 SS-4) TaxID=945553 RepID=A0A0D2NMD2_HYPSF|nr:hypothetical protein HYPSUDRAFT_43629 [Hypholoma sublateritium FD-334 SS-4]
MHLLFEQVLNISSSIQTKTEFWDHIYSQVEVLIDGQRHWISNLANASSVIFNALLAFPKFFGRSEDKAVNWCGFYIHSKYFPAPRHPPTVTINDADRLLLGPFCGKPACQFILVDPKKAARGVCSEAYLQRQTVVVGDVHSHPGHIACDGDTKSEIVIPLILEVGGESHVLGVLDLDCLAVDGFNDEDKVGLEKIARLLANACNW